MRYFFVLALVAVFQASTSSAATSLENPCVYNFSQSLDRLNRYGEFFAFRTTNAYPSGTKRLPEGLIDGSFMRHIQGVARLRDRNVIVASGNAGGGGYLYSIRFPSQPEMGDWKPNLKCSGSKCSIPATDQVVKVLALGNKYPHPGGIQSAGDFVAVGTDIDQEKPSLVRFFDYSDEINPVELTHLTIARDKQRSDAVAFTRFMAGTLTGRYLVAVMYGHRKQITFYLSTSTDLSNPATRFQQTGVVSILSGMAEFQGIQLISQCDGRLFLAGTRKTHLIPGLPWGGKDYINTYAVEAWLENGALKTTYYPFKDVHMKLRQSFFLAGGSVEADNNGKLRAYATDYWPVDPSRRDTLLKFEQFKSR